MPIPNEKPDDPQDTWRRVREMLRAELGYRPFAVWIAPLRFVSASRQRVALGCDNEKLCDLVAERYGVRIANLMARHSGLERDIDFIFEPPPRPTIESPATRAEARSSLDVRFNLLRARAAKLTKERPGFALGDDVLRMMAARIPTDASVLDSALQRLADRSGETAQPITMARATVWLSDFLRVHDRRITVDEVKRYVSQRYALAPGDLESRSRRGALVYPRQLAMYAARVLTGKSFPDIARHFCRDHTTVLHGCQKIGKLKDTNPEIAIEIESIRRALRDWPAETCDRSQTN